MPLEPGRKLGPYEIVEPIGKGGMGEVYRARDTKLDRDVAIKALPGEFANDEERLTRFGREAKLLASLNHPNIASIHGFEDSGGVKALVLELVDGLTLAERIEHGLIPVDEAIAIGKQIADALEAGHEIGVIHRDLKPANIKVKEDGTVKVLDYGLAKALGPESSSTPLEDLSNSPTLSHHGTQVGVILGTAAYMSPEQARGKPVDKRTDVWSFGVVLYEMLTGRRPFEGEDASLTLASVMKSDPDLAALPAEAPPHLLTVLRRCLEKSPKQRIRDIGDVRLALEGAFAATDSSSEIGLAPQPPATSRGKRVSVGTTSLLVVAAALLAGGLVWTLLNRAPRSSPAPYRLSVVLPPHLALERGEAPVLSPDGKALVLPATDESGESRLFIRDLGGTEFRALPGTERAAFPFWSPDGSKIAFAADGYLKRIELDSGDVANVCRAAGIRGGAWNQHGEILFAPVLGPLERVAATGGEPARVTTLGTDEFSHRFPSFLPDGRRFFYSILTISGGETRTAAISALDSKEVVHLPTIVASKVLYADPGFVAFLRGDTVMGQRFDVASSTLQGEAFALASPVARSIYAVSEGAFSMSGDGALAYRSSTNVADLVWRDREGKKLSTTGPTEPYVHVSLAPDDRSLAVTQRGDGNTTEDVWLIDAERGAPTRLTFTESTNNLGAAWAADSKSLIYASLTSGGVSALLRRDLARTQAEILFEPSQLVIPSDISADGGNLLFTDYTNGDLWLLPTGAPTDATPILDSEFEEKEGVFSPDGRWLAYTSNESGTPEIYIQSFPELGTKYRVSNAGGSQPTWRANGRELYYLESGPRRDRMMAVGIGIGAPSDTKLDVGVPRALFEATTLRHPLLRNFAVTTDGQRFLVITPFDAESDMHYIDILLNWTEQTTRAPTH